jgi:Xaa-Pro aminopeptidase
MRQVFFAYAIITPDECTLFANPKSLTEPVRQYLHVNGVAVLEYDRFWSSLTSLNGVVSAARANKPLGAAEKARVINVQGMKINRTDKVLIGTKTSWAIAQALGEVGLSPPTDRGMPDRPGQCRGQKIMR